MGYPSALTAPRWGFQDVLFNGQPVRLSQALGSYVMRHVLFKISFPAEFHAQTAVEAAFQLFDRTKDRLDEISRVTIQTQESGKRIIDKTGPLNNPADRDHCIQYMLAVALIRGRLVAEDYEDSAAADPRIDVLRDKMEVIENPEFSRDYLDPSKRSIGNAVQIFFRDGSSTERVAVEYPIGHPRRRREGEPLLFEKFEKSLRSKISAANSDRILGLFADSPRLLNTRVDKFLDLLVI